MAPTLEDRLYKARAGKHIRHGNREKSEFEFEWQSLLVCPGHTTSSSEILDTSVTPINVMPPKLIPSTQTAEQMIVYVSDPTGRY